MTRGGGLVTFSHEMEVGIIVTSDTTLIVTLTHIDFYYIRHLTSFVCCNQIIKNATV